MIDRLRARRPEGLVVADAVWTQISDCYGEPGRHYHGLLHLCEVAERFTEVARDQGWSQPAEVFVAVLYHDAVYQPARTDNEARSAALARESWTGSAVDLDRVAELIELTATHGKISAAELDPEAALFLDCDMAILAASRERFARYDADVAREYLPVLPADAFATGRAAFLQTVLASPRIFLSDYFHGRAEVAARANLGCALAEARFDAGGFAAAQEAWHTVRSASADQVERSALRGLMQCAVALAQLEAGDRARARQGLEEAIGHFADTAGHYRGIELDRLGQEIASRIDGSCEDRLTIRLRAE